MARNNGVLRFTYVYTLDGKTYTNQVHFFQDLGDLSPTSLALHAGQHATAVRGLWEDNLKPLLTSSVSLVEIGMQYLSQTKLWPDIPPAPVGTPQKIEFAVEEEAVSTDDLPIAGSVAGDYLPAFNAYRARKVSNTPGRRGRGHNSFTGIPDENAVGNLIESGDWSTWQTNAPDLLGSSYNFTVTSTLYRMKPCVLSLTQARANGIEGLPATLYAYEIQSVIPNRLIGTMRRRKKRVV